jgi:hypothetical protein
MCSDNIAPILNTLRQMSQPSQQGPGRLQDPKKKNMITTLMYRIEESL